MAARKQTTRRVKALSRLAPAEDAEAARIAEIRDDIFGWRRWGPYLSDRSWGTVREDYSDDGDAWSYLHHDQARAKAYRWGEDGIAGICDRYQLLCFAPAFWNERDPHLKERLFGVTPCEGNHGEDVKEYYFHVDNTPTHSYMALLYKYPQAAFPYRRAGRGEPAPRRAGARVRAARHRRLRRRSLLRHLRSSTPRPTPEDLVHPDHRAQPRARRRAAAHPAAPVVPQHVGVGTDVPQPEPTHRDGPRRPTAASPRRRRQRPRRRLRPSRSHYRLGPRAGCTARDGGGGRCSPTTRRTASACYGPGTPAASRHTKDAFHRAICRAATRGVSPTEGAAPRPRCTTSTIVPAGGSVDAAPAASRTRASADRARRRRRDHRRAAGRGRRVLREHRPARARPPTSGSSSARRSPACLWTKQSYLFDVAQWLDGDNPDAAAAARRAARSATRTGGTSTRCA